MLIRPEPETDGDSTEEAKGLCGDTRDMFYSQGLCQRQHLTDNPSNHLITAPQGPL